MPAQPFKASEFLDFAQRLSHLKCDLLEDFSSSGTSIFPFEPDEDKGLAILLIHCALGYVPFEKDSSKKVRVLYRYFGNDIFRLNRLPYDDVFGKIRNLFKGDEGGIRELTSVLRSLCDFFFSTRGLRNWVLNCSDTEEMIKRLSGTVYLMGSQSPVKFRARMYTWILIMPGNEFKNKLWVKNSRIPVTSGQTRLMNRYGPVRLKYCNDPVARMDLYNKLYRQLIPDQSYLLLLPFETFLKKTADDEVLCQQSLGCENCPFRLTCPVLKAT